MNDIYAGIDLGQVIIGLLFLLIFGLFVLWGFRSLHSRMSEVEKKVDHVHRSYRDIEPEGYEEEPVEPDDEAQRTLGSDAMSEVNASLDERTSSQDGTG